ncbi:hypothetical protein ONZ45_g7413 [Pleurotus djamor]|nr:hypothetical protein ONZ45_g7413 [Pleurotus djamor]
MPRSAVAHINKLTMLMLAGSLRNTPNLQSLSIVNANFDISDFAFPLDPSQKVPLPHLRSMQIATATVDMSLIFDLIDYPPTTDISFFASQIQELGRNEVSRLMNVCSHVAIDSFCSLAISFSDECVGILLAGEDFNPEGNHLFLALPPSSTPNVYLPLCTVPSFLDVPQLGLDGVTGDWIDSDFLSKFTEMADLHFERCSYEIVQQLLVDDDEQDQEHQHLPMPKLCNLCFYRCSFHPVDSTMEVDEIESLHDALVCLINQRRYIGPKLAHIEIRECHISQDMVWELENHVLVTWDRIFSIPSDEYESGSEEEEGMDMDSDSDPDWHPNDEFYERKKPEAVVTPDDSSDDDISSAATDPGEEADAMDCEMETEEDDGDDIDREYGENRGSEDSYFFPDYYPSDDSHVWP